MTNDNPPEEDKVKKGVRWMNTGKAAGVAGVAVEHLKEWMKGAEDEEAQHAPRSGRWC
jgi:hypothetical protein